MDLNHLLLFVAIISPLVLIARSHQQARLNRGWRMASVAVLLVTGGAWLFFPGSAGFIGGGAWLALLLVPALGARKVVDLAQRQNFGSARRLAQLLAFLHPTDGIPEQARLLRAIELAQRGQIQPAIDLLAPMRSNATAIGRQANAQTFRLRGDWSGLIAWYRTEVPLRDPAILPLYFRALGETHSLDDLLLQFAARTQTISSEASRHPALELSLLMVFAFCGRPASLVRLTQTSLRKLAEETKTFWLATSEIAAGAFASGRAQLEHLRLRTKDAMLRADIEQRLRSAPDHTRAATAISNDSERILRRLENRPVTPSPPFIAQKVRATPVVLALIVLNVAMFAVETLLGGSENPMTLHRLGQLETSAFFFNHEYWRLFTSLFLHFGYLHLLFNLYALFVLGPALERSIGAVRFLACYLLSGIGAGLGVVALHVIGLTPAQEVVGASGSIMGVVGAWAGLLLKNRDAPLAGRRLQSIVVIVVIQTAFDLSTPQVSMGAHLSGLTCGLILGLILAPRGLRD